MIRYSKILEKNPREIVLLKSRSCKSGRGFFCDYIQDNCGIVSFNVEVIKNVTREFNRLEVINSGSVFELPKEALKDIKDIVNEKGIETLYNTNLGVGEINECK